MISLCLLPVLAVSGVAFYLAQVYDKYQNNPEVAFFFVNSGMPNEFETQVVEQTAQFARNSLYEIPFVYDFEGVRHYFRTYMLPAIIIIDKSGNMRVQRYGYCEQRTLVEALTRDIEGLL